MVHFILFYFSHHGNSKSFQSLTSIKLQNAAWCPPCKTPEIPPIHPGSVEEWVGALDWRPAGPGFDCKRYVSAHQSSELREWRQLTCTEIICERRSQRLCICSVIFLCAHGAFRPVQGAIVEGGYET